ncbi:hypothetical protein LX59_01206 [Azomonas agilis]|uniref:Uncharacterized protein n=1 Tax=Azomonas agilis TaxID=116849 RepID=A0A562IZK5_9GAMM|nr:hypothetical protein [Azomonas agilis]TWH76283.1 hypothetical protein LX59_01206 [Azomonas agilis]
MKDAGQVAHWVAEYPLNPTEIDCAVAVKLKILDGKCKMPPSEKVVMALLYDCISHLPGERLPASMRDLIAQVGPQPDEPQKLSIYEQRVLAETIISRPIMKTFKARIRTQGLLDPQDLEDSE